MDNKEKLIKTIQDWVKLDNEIRMLKKETTLRKTEQDKLTKSLMNTMKANDIDEFNTGNGNGKITYINRSVKKPITKKSLLNILSKFYKGNVEKANETNQFILDHREDIVVEKLVRQIPPINIKLSQSE